MEASRLIRVAGDPVLRARASEVRLPLSAAIRELVADMTRLMKREQARGLAAPQLGEPVRLVMLAGTAGSLTCINPRIVRASRAKVYDWESCLSVPGYVGLVPRHRSIEVSYVNLQGDLVQRLLTGDHSTVYQHELDHCNGKLYTERAEAAHVLPESDIGSTTFRRLHREFVEA